MPPSHPADAARQGEAAAGRALAKQWGERLARAALLSRAVTYIVLALVVALILLGRGSQEADRRGAIEAVAGAPFGRVLLLVLCVGFVAYVAWQLLRAVARRDDQGEAANWGRRALAVGTAVVYLSLLVTTIGVLRGSSSSSPDAQQESWTARLLASSGGRLLVMAAGAALVGAGLGLCGYAVSRRFEKLLDTTSMSPRLRRLTAVMGLAGQGARGVVFVIIGGFVLAAALSRDASKSKGLDASLHTLAAQPFGAIMLAVVALGFLCFGLYSLIDARYRKDFSR